MNTPSHSSLNMDTFNSELNPYGNMIIFYNCHLNRNHFLIVGHKVTSQENIMCFQIQI